ncbi:hypothetical protein PSAC2689_170143 [Paraburkholderia sacchari]
MDELRIAIQRDPKHYDRYGTKYSHRRRNEIRGFILSGEFNNFVEEYLGINPYIHAFRVVACICTRNASQGMLVWNRWRSKRILNRART